MATVTIKERRITRRSTMEYSCDSCQRIIPKGCSYNYVVTSYRTYKHCRHCLPFYRPICQTATIHPDNSGRLNYSSNVMLKDFPHFTDIVTEYFRDGSIAHFYHSKEHKVLLRRYDFSKPNQIIIKPGKSTKGRYVVDDDDNDDSSDLLDSSTYALFADEIAGEQNEFYDPPVGHTKVKNRSNKAMNMKNVASLVRDDVVTIVCTHEGSADRYTYKITKATLGDAVKDALVLVKNKRGIRIAKIVEVHDEAKIDPNSDIVITWAFEVIDLKQLKELQAIDEVIAEELEKRQRNNARDQVLAMYGVSSATDLLSNAQSKLRALPTSDNKADANEAVGDVHEE